MAVPNKATLPLTLVPITVTYQKSAIICLLTGDPQSWNTILPTGRRKKAPRLGAGRPAWAAALIAIVVTIMGMPEGQAGLNPPINHVAKVRIPALLEGISIVDRTVEKNTMGSPSKLSEFGFRQSSLEDGLGESILSWAESNNAPTSDRWKIEVKGLSFVQTEKLHIGNGIYLISRSLPRIEGYRSEFKSNAATVSLSEARTHDGCYISPQLPFTGPARFADLKNDPNNQQEVRYENPRGNGIIDDLIEDPHKRAGVSYFVGIFCGAIGIAFYLKGRGLIGASLIALGIFTPLTEWWGYVLIWGATP
jgi:hypothetical protein